ncbi:patatin-like phospholipase family protein [Phocaeicola oris]|uniref:patatin-like phospholipase family protein n=1 Tax=Phocaeicola oris TaxID=2896850 RepID=UPI00234F9FEC|nr:patatin-like phospholipase family protein [Phocaeicola oris]MCE2616644.1 patatin-like phospholipase family protein [Phocaeicola oris]
MKPHYDIGYALSGGFIKGFAHFGMIQSLIEHDIHPGIISGVSAGALCGALLADGREPYECVNLFDNQSFKDFTSFSLSASGLLDLKNFKEFLKETLHAKNIEDLKIPLIITATDLDHGVSVHFTKGNLVDRIAASCCMPILFTPITIGETHYVDGGILMNLPVTTIRKSCKTIIALSVSRLIANEYNMNVISIANRSYNFIFQANSLPQKEIADLVIEPTGLEKFSNNQLEKADEIFKIGYDEANKVLGKLEKELT